MAMINNIRKNTKLMLIVVAGALVLFLLGDWITGSKGSSSANEDYGYGSVNGKTITDKELNQQFAFNPRATNRSDFNTRNNAWQATIIDEVISDQYEELGLAFTQTGKKSEARDLLTGNTIDPELIQMISGGQQLSNDEIVKRITQLESAQDTQRRNYWENIIKPYLVHKRYQNKYFDLLTKSAYYTDYQAELKIKEEQKWVEYNYLFIPFATIDDSLIKDEELNLDEVINDNKVEYAEEKPARSCELLVYDVKPSGADSNQVLNGIDKMANDIIKASNEVELSNVITSNVVYETEPLSLKAYDYVEYNKLDYKIRRDDKDTSVKSADFGPLNKVFGPYFVANNVEYFKVGEVINDTTFKFKINNVIIPKLQDGSRKAVADSILSLINTTADIKSVAFKSIQKYGRELGRDSSKISAFGEYQNDIKSASDLVYSDQELYNALLNEKAGLIKKVIETSRAYYIVNVVTPKTFVSATKKFLNIKMSLPFEPSEDTYNNVDKVAWDFFNKSKESVATFTAAIEKDSLTKQKKTVKITTDQGSYVAGINDDKRELVRAVFDASVTEPQVLPEIFTISRKKIIVAVTGIAEKGQVLSSIKESPTLKSKALKIVKGQKILNTLDAEMLKGTLTEITIRYNNKYKLTNNNQYQKASTARIAKAKMNNDQIGAYSEPLVVGTAFGMAKDKRSSAFVGENGIYVVEVLNKGEESNEKEDLEDKIKEFAKSETTKSSQQQRRKVEQALIELSDVDDKRHKL